MRLFGLTGGIASGKSEAARRFQQNQIEVIDADRLGHALLLPGGKGERALLAAFGEDIQTCGKIDRVKLGSLVFESPEALGELNAIMHPLISVEVLKECNRLADKGHEVVLVEAALLGEGQEAEAWMHGLILVNSKREIRLERLRTARKMSLAEAEARLNAQTPPEDKIRLARWVIENNGSLEDLYLRVDEVAKEIHGST